MKHFIKETDFAAHELPALFAHARSLKQSRGRPGGAPLAGQTWAMIFSKSSTRTRVSFEVGIHELGGNPLFLNKNDIQFGRGESVQDTAKVLSRFVHGLVVRTFDHQDLIELTKHSSVPVINALTDFLHPCQIYADAFTAAERWSRKGGTGDELVASLKGRKIAYVGDTCFNMANSWVLGASLFGMKISLAGPKSYAPGGEIRALLKQEGRPLEFHFTSDPFEAVKDADIVYTDVWTSMGQEDEAEQRITELKSYAVTAKLFAAAKPDALFMHCLPAHAGEEVEQAVLDNPRSIIFDQAENRLHMQKAILAAVAQKTRA